MKKIILVVFIFVFHSFPLFGSPNGNGIICKCIKCTFDKMERGYLFQYEGVREYYFKKENSKLFLVEEREINSFNDTPSHIFWYNFSGYELNRKTLILKRKFGDNIDKRQCEVFPSWDFAAEMEKIKEKYQNVLNVNKKDNRI